MTKDFETTSVNMKTKYGRYLRFTESFIFNISITRNNVINYAELNTQQKSAEEHEYKIYVLYGKMA